MGMTIRAVAVLLINWPSTAVSTNNPTSSACGPASPTTAMSVSETRSAAPDCWNASDNGIIAPTSTTVVHEIDRYA
jgi:hypothetical protein